jgi:hypothetical protein
MYDEPQTGTEQVTIRFRGGVLEGEGEDHDGAFTFRGRYEGAKVQFLKTYRVKRWNVAHRMTYTGVWNGNFIGGLWMDNRDMTNRGPFELWPLSEESELSLSELNALVQSVGSETERELQLV